MFETIPFSATTERLGLERDDAAWVEARLRDPATRFLPMHGLRALTAGDRLAWLTAADLPDPDDLDHLPRVLLGDAGEGCRFVVDVSAGEPPEAACWERHGRFVDARTLAALLPPADSGLLAQARSLTDWHARHRFCARCGSATAAAWSLPRSAACCSATPGRCWP